MAQTAALQMKSGQVPMLVHLYILGTNVPKQAHLASPDRTAIDEVTSDVDPSSADLLCSPRCSTLALHRAMGHRILLCLLESFTAPVCGKVPMLSLMSDMFLPSQSFF